MGPHEGVLGQKEGRFQKKATRACLCVGGNDPVEREKLIMQEKGRGNQSSRLLGSQRGRPSRGPRTGNRVCVKMPQVDCCGEDGGAFCPPGSECPGTEEGRQPLRGGRQCGASAGRAVGAVPESRSVNPLGKGSLAGRAVMPMRGSARLDLSWKH